MSTPAEFPKQRFIDIPEPELKLAIIRMCEDLDIPISGFGYNLFKSIIELQQDTRNLTEAHARSINADNDQS